GSYAEAAEFFAAISNSGDAPLSRAEGLANEALQKSNLGRFAEADSLFAKAAELVGTDPIVARRLRNYRAIHDLNQNDPKAKLQAVRGGKVASIMWMRAQILGDLAAIAEEQKNAAEADRLFRQGVALLEANYPGSAALLNAKARLAGYLARSGQLATAEQMFS